MYVSIDILSNCIISMRQTEPKDSTGRVCAVFRLHRARRILGNSRNSPENARLVFDGGRAKLHRADGLGQEVRHRNSHFSKLTKKETI